MNAIELLSSLESLELTSENCQVAINQENENLFLMIEVSEKPIRLFSSVGELKRNPDWRSKVSFASNEFGIYARFRGELKPLSL